MNRKAEHQRDRQDAKRMVERFPVIFGTDRHGRLETAVMYDALCGLVLRAIRIGRKRGPIPRVILPRFTKKRPNNCTT